MAKRRILIGMTGLFLVTLSLACGQQESHIVISDDDIQRMIVQLKHEEARGRILAANFLGGQGEKAKAAIPPLKELLDDPNPAVKEAAERALKKIEAGNSGPR